VADQTFWDALEVSSAPIFASHSSCRALTNNKRNMTDEMIVALAKKGGVIQVNFFCEFISQKSADAGKIFEAMPHPKMSENDPASFVAYLKEYEKNVPPATLDDVVDHIDYVVKIAGINAVGIGSDFDGIQCAPKGLEDVSKFPNLTRALREKGYSAEDVRKIYGGNTLRLMRAVEAAKR
jgi:membrane dipeptidase